MSERPALNDKMQFLKGVGPRRAQALARRGIDTVFDLLLFLPREYVDLRQVRKIAELTENETQLVRAKVFWLDFRRTKTGLPLVEIQCSDGSSDLTVHWFHRPDLKESLAIDMQVEITGKPKLVDGHWRMTNPKIREWKGADETEGIVPVYPSSQHLSSQETRVLVQQVLPAADDVRSLLPPEFESSHGFEPLPAALRTVHEPQDESEAVRARERIVYEEFLQFALAAALKKNKRTRERGYAIEISPEVDRRIRRLFPFELTSSQEEAIASIAGDLARGNPMHRLLQGDVGSGKTAVAIYAILAVVAAGYQAVFMAPTEILARQQFRVMDEYLARSRVRRRLLTGGVNPADRRELLDALHRGEIDLVVGTHALVQPDVAFQKLGLVVIDEQHKFGVRQRAELLQQEVTPHQIVMTATPIPRSLAMTWFGDLDVSSIRGVPAGRGGTTSYVVPVSERKEAFDFAIGRARRGELVLVVCSRIESADGVAGVEEVFREVTDQAGPDLSVGLVHGKMDDLTKDEVLRAFRRGDHAILVATVVIEVGMDVPDASIVLIDHAERFGLSQLHQIRGRVGRGSRPGTCFFIDHSMDEESHARLKELAMSTDGFEIAELDAQHRGVGDPLGEKQHGVVRPRVGHFQIDRDLFLRCRRDAEEIVQSDPSLRSPSWSRMRSALIERFSRFFGLVLVG